MKHALTALAEVLRTELLGHRRQRLLVCPGVVQTRIAESERNRPPEFPGESHADPALAQRYRDAVAASTTSPDHVAIAVLEALVENRFLVLPSPRTVDGDERLGQMQAAIGP